jgi:hypothetical protein
MRIMSRTLCMTFAFFVVTLLTAKTPALAFTDKPDLISQTFQITYSAVTGLYTMTVGVHNYGPGDAGPCTLKMLRWTPTTIGGLPGARGTAYSKAVPSIGAYGTYYIDFNLGSSNPADDWADFTIDSKSVVNESNESNNTQRVYFW